MRTTIQLDPDTLAAVDELRRSTDVGLSEAVNLLIRRGLAAPRSRGAFTQRSASLGLRIDVSNVAEALELLEGPTSR
jgi:hypothetical protein